LFADGLGDATAGPKSSLALCKSRLVLCFWYRLMQGVLEKRLLNGCSSSNVAVGPPRPSNFCYFRLFHYFCVDFIYFLPPKLIIV